MIDIHATPAPAFIIAVTADGFRFQDVNAACLRASVNTEDEILGSRPVDLFPPPLADKLEKTYQRCVDTGSAVFYESEMAFGSEARVWATAVVPVFGPSGGVETLLGFCSERTRQHKLARREAEAASDKLSLAVDEKGGFWSFDFGTAAFEASPSLVALILGPDHTCMTQEEYTKHIHEDDRESVLRTDDGRLAVADFRVSTYDGRLLWMQSKRQLVCDADGKMVRAVALVRDITTQKLKQLALEDQAHRDELTRLRNRRAFEKQAATRFASFVEGKPSGLAIVIIDLDAFKPINDEHGHRMGDRVLRLVAMRLSRLVREDDMVARIGGDEFAILLSGTDGDAIPYLLERIDNAFKKPLRVAAHRFHVGASCGSASQIATDATFRDVVERADHILYEVKRRRKLRVA